MRVWLVQRAESTPHDDGGDRRLLRIGILADILQSQGHEVIWWTSAFDHVGKKKRYQQSKRVLVKQNYYIHYLKCFGYKKNISLSRYIDNQVVTNQFRKDLRLEDKKPDVILTSVPSVELSQVAVRYANKNKIPVVLDIRDLWPDVFAELLPKSFRLLFSIITKPMRKSLIEICSNATAISGITDNFVNWGLDHCSRERSEKDISFPMAYIKREIISKEKKSDAFFFWEKLGVKKNDKILNVLFLGTFTNSFEFDSIFSAAKILQKLGAPVRFVICGIGAKEPHIRKKCKNLGNCIFAGWINKTQIKTILELSDVGLAPYIDTKNFTENLPNKPAEYLSENLLIATTLKYGKLYDLINSKECGFSYENDPVKLASFLENLSKNEKELKQLKKNAKEVFASELDGMKVYHSMIDYLSKLAKKNLIHKNR
jgi:glycosyltransferase involved in cell wall biosynthesis